MTCRNFESRPEILDDFVSGVLRELDAEPVRAHLEMCGECREAVRDAQDAGLLLRSAYVPATEPSGAFWTRFRAIVREEDWRLAQSGEFLGSLEWLAWRFSFGAALLAVLLLGVVIGTQLPRQTTESVQAESRELVPEPVGQPANGDDVLLELAAGKGRIGR